MRVAGLYNAAAALLIIAAGREADAARPKLAIMPLEAKRVPQDTVEILDVLLIDEVHRLGRYEVIGASDISAMIGFEAMKDALGCSDVACAAELSGALGVQYVLAGSVGRIGRQVIISLTLIDSAQQRVVGRVQRRVTDDEDLYVKAIEDNVTKLFDKESPAKAPDEPWRKHGISRERWEKYKAYSAAAREVSYEPLDAERWKKDVADDQERWLAYFQYYGTTRHAGRKPLAFEKWHTEFVLGRINVRSEPPGAKVLVDGKAAGRTPITLKGKDAGRYRVEVRSEGHLPKEQPVVVEDGKETLVNVVLDPVPAVPQHEPAAAAEPSALVDTVAVKVDAGRSSKMTWGIVSASAAVVLGVGSAVMFGLGTDRGSIDAKYDEFLNASDSSRDQQYDEVRSTVEQHNAMIGIGYGLAGFGTLAAAFAIYEFVSMPTAAAVRVTAAPGGGGALLLLGGSFWP